MLVGDVRWATTGRGSSWKLSGGSIRSSAVTKVSKYRQVRRATNLNARASAGDTAGCPATRVDLLIQTATAGDAAQRIRKGAASHPLSGRRCPTMRASTAAITTALPYGDRRPR